MITHKQSPTRLTAWFVGGITDDLWPRDVSGRRVWSAPPRFKNLQPEYDRIVSPEQHPPRRTRKCNTAETNTRHWTRS